ncbi:MAG: oligosaccharide flippase family protein [Clostridia bacterium]|nr:oligosaccharide flippase family protein [Clostridia bacterium]
MRNQRKAGFVLSYLNIFISSMVGILFTPYMVSTLGPTEYGLYQLLYATIGYIALLDFGLGSTLTRFILKYQSENDKEKERTVISMCVKIYCFFGIIAMLAVALVSFNLDVFFSGSITAENADYAQKLFLIMGATTSISLISHALSGIQTAHEKYIITKGVYTVRQLLRVVVMLVLLQLDIGAMAVVTADLFVTIFLLLFDIFYCKVFLKARLILGKWDKSLLKALFGFSFYVFLQIIIAQTNTGIDRMLLGIFATLEVVALYGVIMQLNSMFSSISNVVCSVTFPQISRVVFADADKKTLTECCARYSRYQMFISAPLMGGFILLGKFFASLWVPEYNSTHVWLCTLIIVIPETLAVVEGTIFHVMKAKNMQKTRSLILLGVTVANVLLTIPLIKWNAVFGPAIGTSVSYIVGNLILSNIYYHKKVGVDVILYSKLLFKGLLPAFILSLVVGVFITMIPVGGWLGFIIKGVLYVGEYGIITLLIGINKDEKALIKGLMNKFLKKKVG